MEVDKGSDQKSDIWPNWMVAHARLKNKFTEDEKYHNLMTLLKYHAEVSSILNSKNDCDPRHRKYITF